MKSRLASIAILCVLLSVCDLLPAAETYFLRGDANADGRRDISDGVTVLLGLFRGGALPCEKSADADSDGSVLLTDAVLILNYLFRSAPPLAEPFEECGSDPDSDKLTCDSFPPCEYETLVASYGVLCTLAGTGLFRDNGLNSWDPDFEGGPATEVELSRPHMAMADDAGEIYIADKDAHAIRKITAAGTIVTVAGVNQPRDDGDEPGPGTERGLNAPNGLFVKGDGTVYILDTGNGKVRRLDTAGIMSTLFAVSGGIFVGRGLWVSDDEQLAYVSAGVEVKRWTPDGGVETYVDGFQELGNLTVDSQGALVVTDRGLSGVFRITEDRQAIRIAGNPDAVGGGDGFPALDTWIFGVRGVWFRPNGGYFLATHEGGDIWYVDTRGIIHLFLNGAANHSHTGDGEHFQTPGVKISEPRAVTVDRLGNVIITENDFGYIRMVKRAE